MLVVLVLVSGIKYSSAWKSKSPREVREIPIKTVESVAMLKMQDGMHVSCPRASPHLVYV